MRFIFLHNFYRRPGGEDTVFKTEKTLLLHNGHEVISYVETNDRFSELSFLKAAQNAIWSEETQTNLRKLFQNFSPDVAHFHNTFLLISPSAYYACKEEGVPVVQTLHNFRLLCPAATFFRDGRICEDCLGKAVTWPGVVHACWRGSRAGTALVSTMLAVHRLLKTWQEQVDVYIALTEFTRQKFIEGGLPANKIVVKPNFVDPDPGMGSHDGEYALFVGRLSLEKGVMTLLRAWKGLKGKTLKIVGEGPLLEKVQGFVIQEGLREVELLSKKPRDEIFRLMQEAQALVFPSEWYEGFPMTIAEAFACGLPVIASRLGAMAEIVEDGRTGLFFEPGDPESLIEQIQWAWEHPRELAEMGRNARREYEMKYTAEKNYQMLMEIYRKAMGR
jgi:glycosyltransferase involved in cell wall biosynthesis